MAKKLPIPLTELFEGEDVPSTPFEIDKMKHIILERAEAVWKKQRLSDFFSDIMDAIKIDPSISNSAMVLKALEHQISPKDIQSYIDNHIKVMPNSVKNGGYEFLSMIKCVNRVHRTSDEVDFTDFFNPAGKVYNA